MTWPAILVLAVGIPSISLVTWLLSPALALPGETPWQPSSAVAVPLLTGGLLCLLALFLAVMITGLFTARRKPAVLILNTVGCGALAYIAWVPLQNMLAWQSEPPIVLRSMQSVGSEPEKAAGTKYLQTITNETITANEFLQVLTPLLAVNTWVFDRDEPSLYLISGTRGKAGDKSPKWEYTIPLGNGRVMMKSILDSASGDLASGNTQAAIEKVEFVIGVGNRVASTSADIIQYLIGSNFVDLAIKFLEEHPTLPLSDSLLSEIERAGSFDEIAKAAYLEDFKRTTKVFESISRREGALSVTAATTNPRFAKKLAENFLAEADKAAPNWDSFVRNHRLKALMESGPIGELWVNISLPSASGLMEGRALADRAKRLVQKQQPMLNQSIIDDARICRNF